MYECFYIIETSPNWYQLRTLQSHTCVSCGRDLEKLLEKVTLYTMKYKTVEKVERVLKKINYGRGHGVSIEALEGYKEQYKKDYVKFNDLIEKAVKEGKERAKTSTPYHRIKKSFKPVAVATVVEEEPVKVHVPKVVARSTPVTVPPVKSGRKKFMFK